LSRRASNSWIAGNKKFNYGDAPADVVSRVETLEALCQELNVSMQAAALQFPLAHPASVTIVSGARNGAQLSSNIEWFEQEIPTEFWSELKKRGVVAEGAPVPSAGA
jgi:D-threo-aldose 1-dehydrogenase